MANEEFPTKVGESGPEWDAVTIEEGRLLFARECRFIFGAASLGALPPPDLTEIAFAGRSNVGKSSLVNALTGRRTLARVSQPPGRTRQINFFLLGESLILVDLPGYGFARAPDRDLMEMLDASAVSYQTILTKVDKASSINQIREEVASELSSHPAAHPAIHLTSARTGVGIQALRATIAALAIPEPLR